MRLGGSSDRKRPALDQQSADTAKGEQELTLAPTFFGPSVTARQQKHSPTTIDAGRSRRLCRMMPMTKAVITQLSPAISSSIRLRLPSRLDARRAAKAGAEARLLKAPNANRVRELRARNCKDFSFSHQKLLFVFSRNSMKANQFQPPKNNKIEHVMTQIFAAKFHFMQNCT